MARTRLRGLEIGGIQLGIEVPENCEWDWPDGPVADYQCLPREPEVHIGLRTAKIDQQDLGGECYAIGAWTFEVARRGTDWLLGLSLRGERAQLAVFDRDFQTGEITVSQATAAARAYPLRGPLDEWIILHRSVARGGLCLTGQALAHEGRAILSLGTPQTAAQANRWVSPSASILGRNVLLVREERGQLRLFRTPWSESIDPALGFEMRIEEVRRTEAAAQPFRDVLDPATAAEVLVAHAVVPLCDDGLLDRVLRNAQRIGRSVRLVEVGESPNAEAPMAWRSAELQGAFAPPRGGF